MASKFNKYSSPAYWTQSIQYYLNGLLHKYLKDNKMTQQDFADKLGVSKGYVSKILNGEFDHKLSKLVELALACDMVPRFEFVPQKYAELVLKNDYQTSKDWENYGDTFASSVTACNMISKKIKTVSSPKYTYILSNTTSIKSSLDWSEKEESKLNAA